MKQILDVLPHSFIRVHHAYIINLAHVNMYIAEKDSNVLIMKSLEKIPVSRRRKKELFESIKIL